LWGPAAWSSAATAQGAWLWQGFLAPGATTLLVSQWHCGKSTLVSILLAKLQSGGSFLGLPLEAGRIAVISEESPEIWDGRAKKLAYSDHVGLLIRPFPARPRTPDWHHLIDRIIDQHTRREIRLLVIDPLSHYLAGSENNAASVLDFMMPLQRLTTLGLSVLLLHHPKKGRIIPGQAARGSGALSSFADIYIEKFFVRRRDRSDRRRRLQAYSRYAQTPQQLVIELNAEETDYRVPGDLLEMNSSWSRLEALLASAPHKFTRQEIAERWTDGRPPDGRQLIRWLEEAVSQGLLHKDGDGIRRHPFRYWLPAREEFWRNDAASCVIMPEFFQLTRD
jgi:hypothetical protein